MTSRLERAAAGWDNPPALVRNNPNSTATPVSLPTVLLGSGVHRFGPVGLPMLDHVRSDVLAMQLNTTVPMLGPFRMPGEGAWDLLVYPGPLMRMSPVPGQGHPAAPVVRGRQLNASA